MKVLQMQWRKKYGWSSIGRNIDIEDADLILVFGGRSVLENTDLLNGLKAKYPDALMVLSSTAGEISDIDVYDDSISAIILKFEKTRIKAIKKNLKDFKCSGCVGKTLINELNAPDSVSYTHLTLPTICSV